MNATLDSARDAADAYLQAFAPVRLETLVAWLTDYAPITEKQARGVVVVLCVTERAHRCGASPPVTLERGPRSWCRPCTRLKRRTPQGWTL